ncbi:tyrosine-type recombinase/integrase [Streptomyces sp. NPDC057746]|uniref:tyrosine-type recombinase/integrase n=1 Tax=Streptomyces sp. NPDC057746 TaxID=3346237 RepID=UPI0036A71269
MATVQARKNRAGEITSYRVKWREGGRRDGDWQSETFDDDTAAETFCNAVNEAGQHWPPGWVQGRGYIADQVADEDRYRFRNFATSCVENKTGIEEHYRVACMRDLETYVFPTFGTSDIRSNEQFSQDTVRVWVRQLEQTKVFKGPRPKVGEPKWRPMSPKTIRNLHSLLSSILQEAVTAEPPLRARNPCERTRLPRVDDDGGENGEDIEFLTPEEVEGIISCMERRSDQLLATVKYGTGMRWSEVTALAPLCLVDWTTSKPVIRVKRAWKRDGQGGYYIGMPKSKRGRRSVRVPPAVVEAVEELGGENAESPERLYFTGDQLQRLHYSTFYDRWQRAVRMAKANGLLPKYKNPTLHDLRHSHAAVLLSEGRGLTYVQRRLGHESIKTTSDTYGHLLPEADDEAMAVIDRSLGRTAPTEDVLQELGAETVDGSRVHVVHFESGHVEAFWKAGDARAVADQSQLDSGQSSRVETWAADWWRRQQTNGLKDVRSALPDRVRLWSMGPAVYGPDGTEQASVPGVHQPRDRWAWEWEADYTQELARFKAEWRPGGETEATAWGLDLDAVRAAYASALTDALRICSLHPAVSSQGGREAVG